MSTLRELEAAATPAPWTTQTVGSYDQRHAAAKVFLDVMATHVEDAPDIQFSDLSYVLTPDGAASVATTGNGPKATHNAALIAAARNALPLLLDVVDAARAYRDLMADVPRPTGAGKPWAELVATLAALDRAEPLP